MPLTSFLSSLVKKLEHQDSSQSSQYRPSPPWSLPDVTNVSAAHPAKARAACPEGKPPENARPLPSLAFRTTTVKITSMSATNVRWGGDLLTEVMTAVPGSATFSAKTKYPTTTALAAATRTAPAAP